MKTLEVPAMKTQYRRSAAPFEFRKAVYLAEVTNQRAVSLSQLLMEVTIASRWSLFFHLHQHFFRDPHTIPEYPNDFSSWVHTYLAEDSVAEKLANLNLVRSMDLELVRREICTILAQHLQEMSGERHTSPENAFVFCKPRLTVLGTGRLAKTPAEFIRILRDIDSDSVGYHLFIGPRLVSGPVMNDFSLWFRQLGYARLAEKLDSFDPYLKSLKENHDFLLHLIEGECVESQEDVRDDRKIPEYRS
jgi:hypothetical protein